MKRPATEGAETSLASEGETTPHRRTVARFVQAVSLDVTGTLIHAPRMVEIYCDAFRRHGVEVEPERMGELLRTVWQEFDCAHIAGANRFGETPADSEEFWERVICRVADYLEVDRPSTFLVRELYRVFETAAGWEVYPEVLPTLDWLTARGLRLVALSNWDERLPRLLAALGLAPYFESVVCSQQLGVEKPHPAIFAEALRRLDLPASRVLHVGDRRRDDVEGALAAGMQAAWVDRRNGATLRSAIEPALDGRTVG